jgi:hypothetical protein
MNPITPNSFAILVLWLWPVAAIIFYSSKPVVPATLWTILAADLLLPVGTSFKFAMIPELDKFSIAAFCALVGCMIVTKRRLQLSNNFGLTEVVIFTFIASPVITSLLNGDTLVYGSTVLPGVGIYDGLSAALGQFVTLIPFFLGRQFLRKPRDLQRILETLVFAGLIYSIPLLFEIRFSPQLHVWVYGYSPTNFDQEIRGGGGYRPMAFMGHGLTACFFLMTTVVASAALWRMRIRVRRFGAGPITAYLGVVLVLCKSGAALVYGLVLVPLVGWAKPNLQLRLAVVFAAVALLYPAMRTAELVPTQTILEMARAVDEARAVSLEVRFTQEEALLQKASERPLFGWGRFGRSRVYIVDWRDIGYDSSVTDGRWVITFGVFGLFGFLAEFGLLAIPIFRAAKALRAIKSRQEAMCLSAIALIMAINMIELLPNSTLHSWSWLVAGALLGCSETVLARERSQRSQHSFALQFGNLKT